MLSKIWSHQIAQDLASAEGCEAAQARELLSRRYGASAIVVLPLVSGEFAVFDATRQLKEISPAEDLADAIFRVSEASQAEAEERRGAEQARRQHASAPQKQQLTKSLEELGL